MKITDSNRVPPITPAPRADANKPRLPESPRVAFAGPVTTQAGVAVLVDSPALDAPTRKALELYGPNGQTYFVP